tara:strand:- start:469 stop:717 length:249 start_codon:yes stop_codon:yes gene_type:complete
MIIRYFAWLKNITNLEEEVIVNKTIIDVKTLKKFLLKKYPKLDKFMNQDDVVRVAINLEYTTSNDKINPNDEIALFPPVSGG